MCGKRTAATHCSLKQSVCCLFRLNCDLIPAGFTWSQVQLYAFCFFPTCYTGTEEENSRNSLTSQLWCACSLTEMSVWQTKKIYWILQRVNTAGVSRGHPLWRTAAHWLCPYWLSWACCPTTIMMGFKLPLCWILFSSKDKAWVPHKIFSYSSTISVMSDRSFGMFCFIKEKMKL